MKKVQGELSGKDKRKYPGVIFLIILIFISSCSIFNKKIENEEENSNNFSNETIDEKKLTDIKNLLKPETIIEEKKLTQTGELIQTGSEIEIPKKTSPIPTPKKIEQKKENILKNTWSEVINITNIQETESGILTKQELEIIENTTDGEIDKLINILFKDLE